MILTFKGPHQLANKNYVKSIEQSSVLLRKISKKWEVQKSRIKPAFDKVEKSLSVHFRRIWTSL